MLEGVLVLSREQKRERLQAIVRKAAEAIFRSEESQNLARYLEEVAYIYYLKAQMEVAQVLFAGALSLSGQPGAAANPLLIFFVEKTLLSDKNEDFGPLENPKTEISPGGIIIPPWINREGEG
ncbi:MAG: hypothetical protein C0407_17320 [Desulfobacca sp.]|nr:hypothetical protein [Desulfobacca sp.]